MNARLEPGAPRPDWGSSEATGTDLSCSQYLGEVTHTPWPAPNSVVPQGASVGTVSDQPRRTNLESSALNHTAFTPDSTSGFTQSSITESILGFNAKVSICRTLY